MENWIITKEIILNNGKKQTIVLLDTTDEVWEFNERGIAENIADILEKNSDSGWKYQVKRVS